MPTNRNPKQYVCFGCNRNFNSVQYRPKFCTHNCYVKSKTITPINKFKYRIDKNSNCWIWSHGKSSVYTGYGQVSYNGRCIGAHRFSWIINKGVIPKGKHILHKCNNKICVNPNHLYIGNHFDNMRDASSDISKGKKKQTKRLSVNDVICIRSEYSPRKITLKFLSNKYGVSPEAIHHVVKRSSWRHVP